MKKVTSTESYKWGIYAPSIIFLAAAVIYSIYWFVAANNLDKEVAAWAVRQEAEGFEISYSEIDVGGFPYRFEARLKDFAIAAPYHPYDWIWTSDELHILSLAYRFDQFIFESYGQQRIVYQETLETEGRAPFQFSVDAQGRALRGSATLNDGLVDGVSIDLQDVQATRTGGNGPAQDLKADRIQLHLRQSNSFEQQETDFGLDLFIKAESISVDSQEDAKQDLQMMTLLQGKLTLDAIDAVTLLKAEEIDRWLRDGGKVTLSDMAMTWDGYGLLGNGKLGVDGRSRPKGKIDMQIFGHSQMIAALVEAGFVENEPAQMANMALSLLALASQNEQGLIDAPLEFRNGAVYLGPARIARTSPIQFN